MMLFCLNCWCWSGTWINHFFLANFVGEDDTYEASTEVNSRGGHMLEQHIPYAPLCLWSQGTCFDPLSSEQYEMNAECLKVLFPFNDATGELSEEKRVSWTKSFPLLSVQHHALEQELFQCIGIVQILESTGTAESLRRPLMKSYTLQSVSIMSLRHCSIPGLKRIFFLLSASSLASVNSRCPLLKVLFLFKPVEELPSSSSQPHITERKNPNVYKLALAFLSTTASYVPCERVFHKILCVACCPQ